MDERFTGFPGTPAHKRQLLRIDLVQLEAVVAHLRSEYPLEGCGLLAGAADQVSHIYPVTNRLKSPTAYEMDPKEQLMALLHLEEHGWDLLAVYHSHPHGPERPSATDVLQATYPDAAHLIVSFRDPDNPVSRAFVIQDGLVDEIVLQVV